MFNTKLPYKFMIVFLTFAVLMIIPSTLLVIHNSEEMLSSLEQVSPLTPEQKMVHINASEKLTQELMIFAFYFFVITFVLSIFFTRRFLMPVRELYRGARLIENGDYDVKLDVTSSDELGVATVAFNKLSEMFVKRTEELDKKDFYIGAMLDPLWVVDEDNVVSDINPAFTRLFGYSEDDVIGSSVFDFVDERSERLIRRKHYEETTHQPTSYTINIISKAEGLIPVLLSESPVMRTSQFTGRIGVMKDFREEAALRDALSLEKDYSVAVMDSMVDQMFVISLDYKIVKANMAARIAAGRDISGEDCHKVFFGSSERCDLIGEDCPARIVMDSKRPAKTIRETVDASGSKAFSELVYYPVCDQNGEVKFVVGIVRDITDRKKFENEIEQKNLELTTINSIAWILNQSLKAGHIFNEVLDKIVELQSMDGGGIFFIEDQGRDLRCQYHKGLSVDFMKSIGRIRIGEDIPGSIAMTGESIITADISKDRRAEKSVLRHSGIKGFACLPIRGKEKLLGVFFVFSFSLRSFTVNEEKTLKSISDMMGITFENIKLYEKMKDLYEQHRQRRAEEQKNLLLLSSMLSATLDMKTVLLACLSLIRNTCRADFAWMLDVDQSDNLLMRTGTDVGFSEGQIVYPAGVNAIERHAMAKREVVSYADIVMAGDFQLAGHLKGFKSAYSIPMFIGDKSFGAFTFYFSTVKTLSEEEIHFLQTVSSIFAVALERAGLYERVIIQKEMADTIVESIADGIMSVDTSGRIRTMSRKAQAIVGITEAQAVGIYVGEIFGRSNTELNLKMAECLDGAVEGTQRTIDGSYLGPDGRRVPLLVRTAPVRDNRDNIAGVLYVIRDISHETEIDRMKTDFLRSVSHEFRTPLTAIVGLTEMILDGEVSGGRATEYLRNIYSEGKRLSTMVSDVLDVARIESGKEIFNESGIDLPGVLKDIREHFGQVIRKKDIQMVTSIEGDISGFKGDEDKIKQLLRNLIDNSISFSDRGVLIDISVKRSGDNVTITVADNGWGMSEADQNHLGEKFYRGANASKVKGTGLGFALCMDIVRLHEGNMKVDSREGRGTSVTVSLPIHGRAE